MVWFPNWTCQNYTMGRSFGKRCPYCPFSFDQKSNRLIYENEICGSNEYAPLDDLIGFFNSNFNEIGGHLDISGGEVLLRKDVPDILASISHTWSITSNTLMTSAIERIISNGSIKRCLAWTASYHPLSNRDDQFEKSIRLLSLHRPARVTVVIANSTIDLLKDIISYLKSLPITGITWHMDAHGPDEIDHLVWQAEQVVGEKIRCLAGPPLKGVMCRVNENLLAVSPDGQLYPCATFAYTNESPISRVSESVKLSELPREVRWCDHECFACCDHIKHV